MADGNNVYPLAIATMWFRRPGLGKQALAGPRALQRVWRRTLPCFYQRLAPWRPLARGLLLKSLPPSLRGLPCVRFKSPPAFSLTRILVIEVRTYGTIQDDLSSGTLTELHPQRAFSQMSSHSQGLGL